MIESRACFASNTVRACSSLSRHCHKRLRRKHREKQLSQAKIRGRVRCTDERELHTGKSIAIDAPPKPVSLPLWQKGVGIALIASVAGFWLVKQLTSNKRDSDREADSLQDLQGSQDIRQDSKDFKAAVARTRQAVSVQKAIGFMDASSPAKAIVELKHALEENGIARGPLLTNKYDKNDRLRLYQLHLQNTEMPPNFAILLQLREMLAISEKDAEQLETEVFDSGSAFSI
ncbi:hypothetical protein WJX79_006400 [Trebouxia sp. C0005]|nr:MAG: hypothetical protein FRX49_03754 [Trebouxia sp. A1-2]